MASPSRATAEVPSARWRAVVRIAALALLFLAYVPPHLVAKTLRGSSPWPARFLASARRIAGARVRLVGAPLEPRTLVIANHVSWLDILVLGGAGAAFVSKAEIGEVPLIGWLADQNHTLYIDRAERGDAHGQVRRIADALRRAQPLVLFPEGTTGNGRALLRFRSTLLQAVAPPPDGVAVRPVAIDYGAATDDIAWFGGEPGSRNVMRVLGRRGTFDVTVRLLAPLDPTADRKALARAAHDAIATALSFAHSSERL